MAQKTNPSLLRLNTKSSLKTRKNFASCWYSDIFYRDTISYELELLSKLKKFKQQTHYSIDTLCFTKYYKTLRAFLVIKDTRGKLAEMCFRLSLRKTKFKRFKPGMLSKQLIKSSCDSFQLEQDALQNPQSLNNKSISWKDAENCLETQVSRWISDLEKTDVLTRNSFCFSQQAEKLKSYAFRFKTLFPIDRKFLAAENLGHFDTFFNSNFAALKLKDSDQEAIKSQHFSGGNNQPAANKLVSETRTQTQTLPFFNRVINRLDLSNELSENVLQQIRENILRSSIQSFTKIETQTTFDLSNSIAKHTCASFNLPRFDNPSLPLLFGRIEKREFFDLQEKQENRVNESLNSCFGKNAFSLQLLRVVSDQQSIYLLIDRIVCLLEKRADFRRLKQIIFQEITRNLFIKGLRLCLTGRFGSSSKQLEKSKKQRYIWGSTRLNSFSDSICFASRSALTPSGKVGVKLWLSFQNL